MNAIWTLQVEAPDYQAGRLAMLQALQADATGAQPGPSPQDGVSVQDVAVGLLASDILDTVANPIGFLMATCDAIALAGLRVRGLREPSQPAAGDPTPDAVRAILVQAWVIYQGEPAVVTNEQLDAFLAHVMPGQPQGN